MPFKFELLVLSKSAGWAQSASVFQQLLQMLIWPFTKIFGAMKMLTVKITADFARVTHYEVNT